MGRGRSDLSPDIHIATDADLQDHWEIHGKEALDEYRHKFVDRYVENYAMLARIIQVEADVKHTFDKPRTVDEALAELESKVGAKGRRKFEKFLREVAEDEDEDVIDVRNSFRPISPIRAAFLEPCKDRVQQTIPVLATADLLRLPAGP